MTRNLRLVMRKLFGFGTAKSLQGQRGLAGSLYFACFNTLAALAFRVALKNRAHPKTARIESRPLESIKKAPPKFGGAPFLNEKINLDVLWR